MRSIKIVLLTLCTALVCATESRAQNFGGTSSMGAGGGGSGGMGAFGSTFGTGTGFGSSMGGGGSSAGGLGGMSSSGSFGSFGLGGSNGFGTGLNPSSMYGGTAATPMSAANGGTRTTSPTGAQSSASRTTSTSGRGGQGGAAASKRRGSNTQSGQPGATANKEQTWFPPRVEIGFEYAAVPAATVVPSMRRSLGGTAPTSRFSGVQIAMDGETAVLRGTVHSLNDRLLAEQIALLEPAVNSVRNELTVAAPAVARPPVPGPTR